MQTPTKANRFMLFFLIFTTVTPNILLVLLLLLKPNFLESKDSNIGLVTSLVLNSLIAFIIPIALYFFVTRDKFKDIIPLRKVSFTNLILIFFMILSIYPLMMLIGNITSLFFENTVGDTINKLYEMPFYISAFFIGILPAILEELAFRGVILSNYKDISIKKAALINGLFFGMMHLNVFQFFYASIMGIILAYFVYYTKSIFSSIFAHFIYNFSQVSLGYFVYSSFTPEEFQAETLASEQIKQSFNSIFDVIIYLAPMILLAIVFLFVFFMLFRSFISINKRNLLLEEFKDFSKPENNPQSEVQATLVLKELINEVFSPTEVKKEPKIYTFCFWASIVYYIVYTILTNFIVI